VQSLLVFTFNSFILLAYIQALNQWERSKKLTESLEQSIILLIMDVISVVRYFQISVSFEHFSMGRQPLILPSPLEERYAGGTRLHKKAV